MKTIATILAFALAGINASAAQIAPKDIDTYKNAIYIALHPGLNCHATVGDMFIDITTMMDKANQAELDESGDQPTITLSVLDGATLKSKLKFTTSADAKDIIKIEASVYQATKENLGDLKNPRIVEKNTMVAQEVCE